MATGQATDNRQETNHERRSEVGRERWHAWFRDRRAFGNTGFSWPCFDYAGPRDPRASLGGARQAIESHFNTVIHENCGDREVADIVAAVGKTEAAYVL